MIVAIFLLFFVNAISIIHSNMTCSGNSTFLSCYNSNLSINISAIADSEYVVSYFYSNGSFFADIQYSGNPYKINLIRNPGVISFSFHNNTVLSIVQYDVGPILTVRLNKTKVPLSAFEDMDIPSFATTAATIFNLYSVPLVLLFLIIIANLSGFPLTYKAGVVALGSFLAGLVFQNPLFYFISFVAIVALGLLKFGGR